jgi:endonuclease/exonuclease/phosphatase (EEP) superfamily protein YafD
LSELHEEYPYSVLHPLDDSYGLALFSRLPIRELEFSPYDEDGKQIAIIVEVELPARRATLVLAHPISPVLPGRASSRNRQIEKIAKLIRTAGNPEQILIGDLNITPWSPYYAPLETEAKLKNAAVGRGYRPTWPTWARGSRLMKIPIDHCLLSDGFQVQQFRTGTEIGSDHLPIIVDIANAASAPSISAQTL